MKISNSIISITNHITCLYNYLFNLELNNKINNEYYSCIEILKDLLEKENILYINLSEKDIIALENYSGYENSEFDDIFEIGLDNLEDGQRLICEKIKRERIKNRLSIYQYINIFEDENWYNNIYKGVYLNKCDKNEFKELVNYIYIQSLYMTLSYINVINKLDDSSIKLCWKYLHIFIEPFTEKYVINNSFEIIDNGDYIINLSLLVNSNDEYITSAREIFSCYLKNMCGEIIYDYYQTVNACFLINLTCIKSFLEIINEDDRREIVNFSNDTLNDAGNPNSECIDMYFNLFDECQYVKKKV